jgi:hypothetical protein
MINHSLVHHFLFWGKVAGAVMAFASVLTFLYQKVIAPIIHKVEE